MQCLPIKTNRTMKHTFKILFFSLLFFISCEKETEFEMPVVLTGEVTNISQNGAILNARVTNLSNEDIVEYGFVIDTSKFPSTIEGKIIIKKAKINRDFSFDLQSGLKDGKSYNIRSFIRTISTTVYGNSVSFRSQGSRQPVIKDFNPKMGPIGTKVVIEGENFGYLKNEIKINFGNVTVLIDSLTDNMIFVKIPNMSSNEEVKINIEIAGMKTESEKYFSLWFPWKKITDNNNFWCEASFQIGNLGYMLYRGEVLIFNLELLKWEITTYYAHNNSIAVLATTLNDKAYILFKDSFWEYHPSANQWKKLAFPSDLTISGFNLDILYYERYNYFLTSLNNDIVLGSFKEDRLFWEYDIITNKWSKKYNENVNMGSHPTGSFSELIDNQLHIGLKLNSGSQFWQMEAAYKEWNYIGNLPIDSYSFWGKSVIENNLYLCFGKNHVWPMESSNEIWEFNPVINEWKQFHNCPENCISMASFTYNNKAYLFTPWTTWEFDPVKN